MLYDRGRPMTIPGGAWPGYLFTDSQQRDPGINPGRKSFEHA
jgi:hypothetical protein